MTPEQFVYWLQGFLEVQDPKALDERQTQIIKDHMATVLIKETPNRPALPRMPDGKLCAPVQQKKCQKTGDLNKDLEELARRVLQEDKPKKKSLRQRLKFPNLRLGGHQPIDPFNQTYC